MVFCISKMASKMESWMEMLAVFPHLLPFLLSGLCCFHTCISVSFQRCPYNCSFRNSMHKRWIVLASNANSTSSSFLPCTKNGKSFSHFDQEKPEQTDRLCGIPQGSRSRRQGREPCSGDLHAGSFPAPLSPRNGQLEAAALALLLMGVCTGKVSEPGESIMWGRNPGTCQWELCWL